MTTHNSWSASRASKEASCLFSLHLPKQETLLRWRSFFLFGINYPPTVSSRDSYGKRKVITTGPWALGLPRSKLVHPLSPSFNNLFALRVIASIRTTFLPFAEFRRGIFCERKRSRVQFGLRARRQKVASRRRSLIYSLREAKRTKRTGQI